MHQISDVAYCKLAWSVVSKIASGKDCSTGCGYTGSTGPRRLLFRGAPDSPESSWVPGSNTFESSSESTWPACSKLVNHPGGGGTSRQAGTAIYSSSAEASTSNNASLQATPSPAQISSSSAFTLIQIWMRMQSFFNSFGSMQG